MKLPASTYDVLVVGAGHAGCEAALAAARMGGRVALCTLSRASVAEMPCNPAIGGLAKSHLVREIDALGGAMGRAIDRTGIQFRTLNVGKGPAVQAPRAQADKRLYREEMRRRIDAASGVDLLEAEVLRIEFDGPAVHGVLLGDPAEDGDPSRGSFVSCRAVVITTGTFLYGLMHIGNKTIIGGRRGEKRTTALSDCIRGLGIRLGRFKTGTPPRLDRATIRFDALVEQPGDTPPPAFSHFTTSIPQRQVSCWITRTSERTADVVRANLAESPLYSGTIQGIGPRYCPSFEDKIVKFPDKPTHQIFLEPEGYDVAEFYVNGLSTSMPEAVQEMMVRSIPGLEDARILRPGYAVEYDCLFPVQLSRTLMVPAHPGLFFAGQINGTSGYEEAAAQGLVGGVNAMCHVRGRDPFVPSRSEGYLGVLIDDLVTRGVQEPYRMFTSQAEYRLILRCDNAGDRFGETARAFGLLTNEEADLLAAETNAAHRIRRYLEATAVPREARSVGASGSSWADVLRRAEISMDDLLRAGLALEAVDLEPFGLANLETATRKAEIEIKYAGYVRRMEEEVERTRSLEGRPIPDHLLDRDLVGVSIEALQKLRAVRPETFGQAGRIAGVTPADLSVLIVHVEREAMARA
jgi:tRNA uridine 5-carboxymethylaminomethyl modification enzyme